MLMHVINQVPRNEELLDTARNLMDHVARNNQPIARNNQLIAKNEQLVAKNKQLVTWNKQLVAENKQPVARNEQLVAENEQLVARNEQLVAENKQLVAENKPLVARNKQLANTASELMDQVDRDKKLLDTAKDCFHFVTEFFEPINISATHIYHSALELSPLSSTVRRLYHHQQHTPLPRVVVGSWDSWDQGTAISGSSGEDYASYTWSPCGQFIATHAGKFGDLVEIRDGLTLGLLSTLAAPDGCLIGGPTSPSNEHSHTSLTEISLSTPTTPSNHHMDAPSYLIGGPTYSPDGRSLASLSYTSLIVWDVQTGGVTKQIEHSPGGDVSLVWSLDGGMVGSIFHDEDSDIWTVHVCDVALGTTLSSTILPSIDKPHLWAHGTSFQVMITGRDSQGPTIDIFEVWSVLTKIESFQINLQTIPHWVRSSHQDPFYQIGSFSPTTYHISISMVNSFAILDIRSSECLLEQEGSISSDSFSPNGSLFTACFNCIRIWKHTHGYYTLWRVFPLQGSYCYTTYPLHFSPSLSSVLGGFPGANALQVWHLDGFPIMTSQAWGLDNSLTGISSDSHTLLAAPHCCATYVVSCHMWDSTITITNLLSQTLPYFIDTGMKIEMVHLIGNIVLAVDFTTITAWQLTEDGAVGDDFYNRRAGYSDRIWTIPRSKNPKFLVENQTMFIQEEGTIMHIYHTKTGEALALTQANQPNHLDFQPINVISYHLSNEHNSCSEDGWPYLVDAIQKGWIKDPEQKHRLWMPIKWRSLDNDRIYWLHKTKTLWFTIQDEPIVIKF